MSSSLRAAVLLVAMAAIARPAGCAEELLERWNQFAGDANAYVSGLAKGLVDARVRGRLDKEWRAVTRCECW